MTQFPDLFAALAAPFAKERVKTLAAKGNAQYVTARTVANRLDDVLGPEHWWDEYHPLEHSVICRLTLRLPDGTTVTKADVGGMAGMADAGDDDKSGFSDAFKRAAGKFGIGRYLYRDGVPNYGFPENAAAAFSGNGPQPAEKAEVYHKPPPAQPRTTGGENGEPVKYGWPSHGGSLYAWCKNLENQFHTSFVKAVDDKVKDLGLPRSWKEWDKQMVERAARYVARKVMLLPGYDGQFDSRLPNVGTLKGEIVAKVIILIKRTTGNPPTSEAAVLDTIRAQSEALPADAGGGQVITDFANFEDVEVLQAVLDQINADLADSNVPY